MKIKKYSNEKNGASFSKKALSYAAMTGAFLATGERSEAQIVYTDINPDHTVQSTGAGLTDFFPIDFDNDGVADVVVQHYIATNGTTMICWVATFSQTYSSGVPVLLVNRLNRIPGTINTFSARSYLYPNIFNNGDIISSGNTQLHSFYQGYFKSIQTLNWISTGQYGQWDPGVGFMGLEFNSGSNIYYGWLEMDVDAAATRTIVKGYAYESTPSGAIHAGDTGPLGISENQKVSDGSYFLLSGNPVSRSTSSAVWFSTTKQQDYKIEVVNNLGDVVKTFTGVAKVGEKNVQGLHLQDVATGNYFVRLTMGDKVQHRRLIVAD
jgi:hypothetical protein